MTMKQNTAGSAELH